MARLGELSGPLGGILAHLGAVLAYLGGVLGRLGGFLGPQNPSEALVQASWSVLGSLDVSPAVGGGGYAGTPLQDSSGFPLDVIYVYPYSFLRTKKFGRIREGKEDEKVVRIWNFIRHAQAQGLARRIQRAAELRTRHRA